MKRTAAIVTLVVPLLAWAGAQKREPIDPVVLATLSARIADRAPETFNFRSSNDAHKWIYEMSNRLQARIPDRTERILLLKTIQFEAVRNALDPQLVLGVIEVESAFRRYAVSSAGARGLMQVMPFWTAELKRPHDNLFHRRLNVRYGCLILRYYLDMEKGDLYRALGRYNGSLGRPEYPNTVLSAWQGRWRYDGATS